MESNFNNIMDEISPAWGVCDASMPEGGALFSSGSKQMPKGAASIIVALFPYYLGQNNYAGLNISRYAVVPDYHKVVINRLNLAVCQLKDAYPKDNFTAFVDSSPLREVKAAALARLGVIGKNGLLINPVFGSWVFIGEIVSTKRFETPAAGEIAPCVACGKCISLCPAKALTESGFDRTKCLSHITQSKGELTGEAERRIKASGCAWGCDICQIVCPMNQDAAVTPMQEFQDNARLCVKIGDDIEGRAYAWRGRDVIERNLKIIL